ncbi:hypothetical protein EAG_03208 [Camponotus floridanus]|uniref:Uncharacterized protein n=1 Tax=Camponotus floridanus TaxID=104421 RepID=E1ZZD5_CAMFO|nr:hypothetical protein EAG_03208 [Camponotus floridanus]
MSVPTFVYLQGFATGKLFFVKESTVLKKGYVLSHYFFASPVPWSVLTKSERCQVLWLTGNHHGLIWVAGNVPYGLVQRPITTAIVGTIHEEEEEESSVVYVKGLEKRKMAGLDDAGNGYIIETLDADYEDIDALNKLDIINSMRCGKHVKNCALQNVFKIFNWWSRKNCDISSERRAIRILGRPYALTATEFKFLEIDINVSPPNYVKIAIGDHRGKELILSLKTWKGLCE